MLRFRRIVSLSIAVLLIGTIGACDQAPTGPQTEEMRSAQSSESEAASTSSTAPQPERHIVGVSSESALQRARGAAESVYRVIDLGEYGTAVAGVFPEEALEGLRGAQGVDYVEPDRTYEIIGETLPWGIDRVDADVAHASGETGEGADVSIIDTGIDSDHPDLKSNLGTGKAFVECKGNPNICNRTWDDDNDHGTHVSGTVDAIDNTEGVIGVSTEATLHAAKVCDKNGFCSSSDIAAALEWTADQGYDVANLSLGGSYSSTIDDAGQYAFDKGVLLVAAAGNDGPCTDCVGYPAANEEFIAVSATTSNDELADFSSQGPEIELAAPGNDIYSTVIGSYDTFSGTSMASPHVAGAGAQLMANGYSNTDARDQLGSTAENIGLNSNKQGQGLVDVEAALGLAELSVDELAASEVETENDDAEFEVSWSVSDPDGNLKQVNLVLQDQTSGSQEESTSISVSGDKASGETRLVALGDEESGHSYEITATVTDADDNTASKTITVSETEDVPTVDNLSLSEVETSDSDAEFDVEWGVSDDDGDLSSLELTLYELQDGSREKEDSATPSVSGSSASESTRLIASGDDGSGNTYEVEAMVTDSDGTTDSQTDTATESESTSSAPTVDTHAISEAGSPNPHLEITVDWGVSDDDGDLAQVTITAKDPEGNFGDTHTYSVSGSSASGTDEFKFTHVDGETADVTIEVTDSAGNTDSHTEQVTE